MKLAEGTFTDTEQQRFASASGDRNPMHVDALLARRTQAGAPVVHGINILLWALDSLAVAQPDLPPLRGLRAHFNKFIYLNECVDIVVTQQGPTGARLNLSVGDGSRSKITLAFGDAVEDFPDWVTSSLQRVPLSPLPLNLVFEDMSGRSGRIPFQMSLEATMASFPSAAEWLGAQRIAALAASSHLVGMVCPGLHSVYSELSVRTCAESILQDSLAFRVVETDPRFRSVDMEIAGGGLAGIIYSSARMPPVQQATMESLKSLIAPTEFSGSLVLIVGGSRGLGELTAKLIATGGGRVIVTWKTGKDDAERVAQEIDLAGGACETLSYDALKPVGEQLERLVGAPTHVYYFATPTIFRPQSEVFSGERLEEFLATYVGGFWKLSEVLRARQPRLSVFYPSSVFVTERPEGMTEYSMAKAAGEMLCADMNVTLAPMHVTVTRLPRLPSDQTASVIAAETALPLETMLPLIREVQSWPRQ